MKKKITIILFSVIIIIAICILAKSITYNADIDSKKDNLTNQSGETQNNIQQQNESIEPKDKIREIEGVKQIGNIEISDIKIELVSKDKSKLTASVKNVSKEFLNATNVKIKVINDKEEEISFGGIITELAGYETDTFTTYVMKDILDAKDLEIQKEEI